VRQSTMKSCVAVVGWMIGSLVLSGCVSSGRYHEVEDDLVTTQEELGATKSSLDEAEGMLVDMDAQRAQLQEKAAQADKLKAENEALAKKVADLQKNGAISAPDGTVIFTENGKYGYAMKGDVIFAPGSDKLTKEGERILTNLAAELKKNHHPITVVGHTDSDPVNKTKDKWTRGNIELGANRAMTVRDYLIEKGLPQNRISITSYGEYKPVASGSSAEAKAKNRRVEVMVGINEPDSSEAAN
jgi:chemotaxis protein MotB